MTHTAPQRLKSMAQPSSDFPCNIMRTGCVAKAQFTKQPQSQTVPITAQNYTVGTCAGQTQQALYGKNSTTLLSVWSS